MRRPSDRVANFIDAIAHFRGAVFHVTDEANLSSIAEHGLLSKQEAHARGVMPTFSGGNGLTQTLDWEYGWGDSVFLGFHKSAVMPAHENERHRRRPIRLHVHPDILGCFGVKIALGRANHRGTKAYSVSYALQLMDLEALDYSFNGGYDKDDFDMRRRVRFAFDYEILVPKQVPAEFIIDWG